MSNAKKITSAKSRSSGLRWSALKEWREERGWDTQEAAQHFYPDLSGPNLTKWEKSGPPVFNRDSSVKMHVLDVANAYELTGEKKAAWIEAVLPPLSPRWLEAQPEKKRAGLMLMSYRQHLGHNRLTLGRFIGSDTKYISAYENGELPIPEAIFKNASEYFRIYCPELFSEKEFRRNQAISQAAFESHGHSDTPARGGNGRSGRG